MSQKSIDEISAKVLSLKEAAQDIKSLSNDFPAVQRNISRIMASIKMLEINTVDLAVDE
jgi:arginine utilization protein RocB